MNVHFTYKLSKTPDVDQSIQQHIEKLNRRLLVFKPDMVALNGSLDESPRNGFVISLNLRLPSGQMAARSASDTLQGAIKSGFDDLLDQLTKHKDRLRNQYHWPRERGVAKKRSPSRVPFEETLAAVPLEKISAADITGWVDANVQRLQEYIERELTYRRDNGQRHFQNVTSAEVLDEVIATALDDHKPRPEKMVLEHWLYRLALAAMDRVANQEREDAHGIPLGSGERQSEETGSDEAVLQYHQPDEALTYEGLIADGRARTPEQAAADSETVTQIERALRSAKKEDRDAFMLFNVEGFTLREIGQITDRPEVEVRESVRRAREHLRKVLPVSNRIRDKLFEQSKPA